ncbi:hypothetical protein MOBT1_001316 [Malassezia obtusa]|uniref:Inositol polyphosphate-related phosphatase domain-containing protein n=1 Tax=Malassezia obtusa TaxID=76774 RepID=A0AAF0E0A0_9BASI|nr:hypothetical protein MOBT1_001316 [Malassezia obtusa]
MADPGVRVQVASFNANQRLGENALPDFTPWLIPKVTQDPASGYATSPKLSSASPQSLSLGPREAPDLYAVGFQEFAALPHALAGITESIRTVLDREIRRTVRLHQATVRSDQMYDPIELGGGPENYSCIAEVYHGGTLLYVYARERPRRASSNLPSVAQRVKEVRTSTVGTGMFDLMGNKGAVGARVTLGPLREGGKDEVFTFVCAHLTPHDHNVERRNADWKSITERLVFGADSMGFTPNVQPMSKPGSEKEAMGKIHSVPTKPASQNQTAALDQNEYSVYDTHHLFVLGDLNYRIGTDVAGAPPAGGPPSPNAYPPMKAADVKTLARSKNPKRWNWLLPYDQLGLQHAVSPPRAFQSLHVPDLASWNIPPTYKYKIPLTPADARNVLNSKRLPGWPDRILWSNPDRVACELYRSLMEFQVSDHKPITTILSVPRGDDGFLQAPYPINPQWRTLQFRGRWLDRIVGYLWSTLLLFGNGNLPIAALEIALLAILGAWWVSGRPIPYIRPTGAAR